MPLSVTCLEPNRCWLLFTLGFCMYLFIFPQTPRAWPRPVNVLLTLVFHDCLLPISFP